MRRSAKVATPPLVTWVVVPVRGPRPEPGASDTVIGTAAAGKLLTGLSGNWAGSGPTTYKFQWYRCNAAGAACRSVRGATSPTFALGDLEATARGAGGFGSTGVA